MIKDTNPLDLMRGIKQEPEGATTEESSEPQEPVKSNEPVEPEEPTEPVEPTEPQEPVEPTEPQEPVEPTEPQEPTEPEKPKPITESEEYKKLQSDFERLKTEKEEIESLLSDADPLKYFASESEYRKQQILKSNPDVNPSALDELLGSDLKNMKPEDVVTLNYMVENPGVSKDEVKRYVLERYNFDPEENSNAPFGLVADANKARKSLQGIVGQEIEKPKDIKSVLDSKKQAFTEKLEKSKADFEPIVKELANEMNGIERSEGKDAYLKYDFDPDFKAKIADGMLGYVLSTGATLDNAEQALSEARAAVEDTYILSNLKKIIKAHVDEAVSKKDNEWRAKVHNPKPTSQQTAPASASRDTSVEDAKRMVKGKI